MSGGWVSPKITADVYDLTNARGKMNVTDDRDHRRRRDARATAAARSPRTTCCRSTPSRIRMTVDLRYNGVSLEKLFNDWGIKDTGLRGGATGRLAYHWNKDKVLAGAGNGTATLAKHARPHSRTRSIRSRSAARPTSRSTTAS